MTLEVTLEWLHELQSTQESFLQSFETRVDKTPDGPYWKLVGEYFARASAARHPEIVSQEEQILIHDQVRTELLADISISDVSYAHAKAFLRNIKEAARLLQVLRADYARMSDATG